MALIPPTPPGTNFSSYSWQDWYQKIRVAINNSTSIAWSQITDFTGSTLTAIQTRLHNDLQSIQGGNGSTEYYHLTAAEYTAINTNGVTAVITTAKLTGGGANGSMTFTNGILTAHTDAT